MEQRQLLEALSDPSAYPAAVDAVDVFQTHISAIFLAGNFAYKIKKRVDLGFVDYRALERRRHFCEEEVCLNRRLAPEVYLGVVPVGRDGPTVRMEGPGEVVEWAVKMKRLPDAATLRSHLDRGEIGVGALEELGCRLARFHAEAESGGEIGAGASFEAIARNARENFEQSSSQVGVTVSKSTLDRLKVRTETDLAGLRGLVEDRVRRGIPRDTHCDLRLDHVYWFPERQPPDDWVVVDCIEFADRFRHADPVSDIAFLAMELSLGGHGDLATAFTEAYFRGSGDDEGSKLLPFYKAYRAAVRGKVEGMKLGQGEVPADERSRARDRSRALWLFALAELEDPSARPGLVLVAGLPGSGKSTLARDFAECAGFAVIRSDENSKDAFRVSCAVAIENKTEIVVLHVEEPDWIPEEPVCLGQQAIQFRAAVPDEARLDSVERQLRETYVPDRPVGVSYRTKEGYPSPVILRMAEEVDCDLIVMGTHGRTGLRGLLAGSVAVAVLRGARCPVLALKANQRARESEEIRVILHPTDFSVDSDAALKVARSIARDRGARLIILHVATLEVLVDGAAAGDLDLDNYRDALEDLRKRTVGPDLKRTVETLLTRGLAAAAIVRSAEGIRCDLIVMGTHGYTGLTRLVMGSVAEAVLPRASCPVLIVKAARALPARASDRLPERAVSVC